MTPRTDLIDLFEFVWPRFVKRMDGLTDTEWRWLPTSDPDISLRWRIDHMLEILAAERNAAWLDVSTSVPRPDGPGTSAADAQQPAEQAWLHWRSLLELLSDDVLFEPMGPVAGRFGTASRFAFGLHIADEFIHHSTEAALLRDLYAARERQP